MAQPNTYPSPIDERIVTFFAGMRSFLRILALFLATFVVWTTMPESLKSSPYQFIVPACAIGVLISAIPTLRSGYIGTRSTFENFWFYETPNRRAGFLIWCLTTLARGLLFYVRFGFYLALVAGILGGVVTGNVEGFASTLFQTLVLSIPLYGFPLLLEKTIMNFFWNRHLADRKAAFAESSGRGYMIRERKPSESDESTTTLSQDERDIVTLADALLDSGKADAVRTQLARRGQSARRVLALLLGGNIPQSKWWYWTTMGDDLCLEYLWKLEEAIVALGPPATDELRRLLHHPRWTTQFMAINALGDLRDRESLNDILQILKQAPSSFRRAKAAIEAIGKIGDPTAIPYLEEVFPKASIGDQNRITEVIKNLRSKK
jgi:hypothetical protein